MHEGRVDHHVVVNELGRTGAVRHDAADGARDEEHVLGAVFFHPPVDRGLVAEVELTAPRQEQVVVSG